MCQKQGTSKVDALRPEDILASHKLARLRWALVACQQGDAVLVALRDGSTQWYRLRQDLNDVRWIATEEDIHRPNEYGEVAVIDVMDVVEMSPSARNIKAFTVHMAKWKG